MQQEIKINETETDTGWKFGVTIQDEEGQSSHTVTMSRDLYESFSTNASPEKVIKESFFFLLEREPKNMILSQFDITTISRYFPEYPKVIKKRLS